MKLSKVEDYKKIEKNIWFPAQIEPGPEDPNYINYWKREKSRCVNGFYIGGENKVFIPGLLYWHTVYWTIELDIEIKNTVTGKINSFKGAGTPILRDIEWEVFNELEECANDGEHYCLVGSRGFGKDLEENTLVHLKDKSIPIKDVQVGNKIYGADGELTTVINKKFFYDQLQYEITFSDGRKIQCGGGHLWTVFKKSKSGYKKETLELKDIYNNYLIGKRKDSRYFIPITKPLNKSFKNLPIDPYYLGLWLGDGTSRDTSITTIDEEIVSYVKSYAESLNLSIHKHNKYSYRLRTNKGSKNVLLDELKNENLLLNKHIPEIYLNGSFEQRLSLLQGIMDTDGYISKGGSIELSTSCDKLKTDYLRLISSLGIRFKTIIKKTKCKDSLRIALFTDLPIFKLSRKLNLIGKFNSKYSITNRTMSAIIDIKPIGIKPSVCIAVDNEDKLFLAGEHYIVTHNSMISSSFEGHGYTFFNDAEILSTGGNTGDIDKLNEKISYGLSHLHKVFQKKRIKNDWKKMVKAGWIDLTTGIEKGSKSRIVVRNYSDGNDPMATNGTRPKRQVIDEIGKIPNLVNCILASVPSWQNDYGVFCTTIFTGCVCAGTKVYTNDGRVINIENLKQEDGIIGFDGKKSAKQKINWFKEPTKKPCYRITTDNNTVIECSDDHPLLITKRKLYKKLQNKEKLKRVFYQEAKHIQIKDQVITIDKVDIFGNYQEKDARLLGLLIGDGNYSLGATPTLSVSEKEILDFVKPFSNGSSNNYEISKSREYKQVYLQYIKDKLVNNKMYGQVKENKRLPYNIHTYNKESLCELLAGYFDADGNVYYNEKKKIVRVVLTSIVYELLEEVKYNLLKLGIHCSIIKEKRNTIPTEEFKGQKNYIYRLYISQQQDLILFRDNIKLLVKEKVDKLNFIKESKYKKFNGLFEINPLNNKEGYFNREEKENNILENLRYETVKSIEYIGEKEVYNLNCSINHNYISNSLITRQTGGDMEKGKDAGVIFNDPITYNIKSFINPKTGLKIGKFMPVTKARNEYKYDDTLYNYLKTKFPEKYGNLTPHPELLNIIIKVSDEEKCMKEFVIPRREKMMKASNSNAIISEKAYYPITPEECFLTISSNDYPVEALEEHKLFLNQSNYKPLRVELYLDRNGEVKYKSTDKMPVTDFPVTSKSNKEGVIEIVELPPEDIIDFQFVAGIDPYKTSESDHSESVGSVYIWKRKGTDMTEIYQDMPVAWYHGRPRNIAEWQENVRLLLKFYNATAMCESNDENFITYMMERNEEHYLARGQSYLKEINPNSKFKGAYGMPATAATIKHWNNASVRWTKEVVSKEEAEGAFFKEENNKKVMIGATRVLDPLLLEELIKFNKNTGNYDRQRAFSIACAYAKQLDVNLGYVEYEPIDHRERDENGRFKGSSNKPVSNFFNKVHSISASPFKGIKGLF